MYEKRKAAALEIEKMVKDFVSVGNSSQIKKLLKVPLQIQIRTQLGIQIQIRTQIQKRNKIHTLTVYDRCLEASLPSVKILTCGKEG